VKEILSILFELENWKDTVLKFNLSKPSMIPVRLIDTTKAKRLLGFEATTDIRHGARKTIEWYKNNRNNMEAYR
jgi:nucleoside-diphosphate-sugar epimerase